MIQRILAKLFDYVYTGATSVGCIEEVWSLYHVSQLFNHQGHHLINIYHWKCNISMSPHIRLLVGGSVVLLVVLLVRRTVCHYDCISKR